MLEFSIAESSSSTPARSPLPCCPRESAGQRQGRRSGPGRPWLEQRSQGSPHGRPQCCRNGPAAQAGHGGGGGRCSSKPGGGRARGPRPRGRGEGRGPYTRRGGVARGLRLPRTPRRRSLRLSPACRGGARGPRTHAAASLAAPSHAAAAELGGVAHGSRISCWGGVSSLVLPLLQPPWRRHGRSGSGSGAGGGVKHAKSPWLKSVDIC